MNNDYQENPERNQEQFGNQQEPSQRRETEGQYGNQQGQYGNSQGQFGNQQGQYGNPQEPFGGQQGQYGNPQQGNPAQQRGMLSGARDMAQNQIDQVIDQYANKIPGGSGFTQQAKEAASGILDGLEKEGENRINEMGGGLFGGNKEKQ
jgi:hypothetical protein